MAKFHMDLTSYIFIKLIYTFSQSYGFLFHDSKKVQILAADNKYPYAIRKEK